MGPRRTVATLLASIVLAFFFLATGAASAHKHQLSPIQVVASAYHWDGYQVDEWRVVIWDEDRDWSLTASNGSCYGIGQLLGGDYSQYPHGSSYTLIGQLWGMAGYIRARYGDPAAAVQHEIEYHWY